MKNYLSAALAFLFILSFSACADYQANPLSSDNRSTPLSQPEAQSSIKAEIENSAAVSATATDETISSNPDTLSTPEIYGNTEGHKTLIAYFTLGRNANYPDEIDAAASASLVLKEGDLYGATEYVAYLIQGKIGGELYSIQTLEPYPTDFDAVVEQNHEESAAGVLPALADGNLDISQYDTVFLGYPVWASSVPQAIQSFLTRYDLSGKTVVPFCTHDGYGAGISYREIAAAEPQAAVLAGIAIQAENILDAQGAIADWLEGLELAGSSLDASNTQQGTHLSITVGGIALEGVLYDTALANEIRQQFPLTVSMVEFDGREYYGGVDFYPESLEGGQRTFENGEITYCEEHHNIAIFYAQTNDPILSVDVFPIGRVTSDLSVFDSPPGRVDVTFALAN
ncbi:flavodoxin [Anaerotruncus colihominis]|uniref:flavodoxin n=1 Tax=Anaerotruncus colihominis TaxID=169435 RepID=UPI00189B5DE4|nr:cyclophilin-like fold protein [Anaerotruncus colihominis]